MKTKSTKKIIIAFIGLFMLIAIMIEVSILLTNNKKQVYKTSQIILNEIENILELNKRNEEEIINELKIEYSNRANTVAYILDNKKDAIDDIDELKKIALMMDIDEICLFDSNGVIFGGTHPNYIGISFDSGEQVGFFKPMLSDKNLTMCQDVTPNTAESKNMMYAMTWDQSKKFMVQVGVEPIRFLDELNENSTIDIVQHLPIYKGTDVYIVSLTTGQILGSSNRNDIGSTIYECGILKEDDDLYTIKKKSIHLNGYRHYCNFRQNDNYLIMVLHSTQANVESFLIAITIELVWLIIAGTFIYFTLIKLINANKKINKQMSIVTSIADIYYSMHLIDLLNFHIEKIEGNDLMDKIIEQGKNAKDMIENIINTTIEKEYLKVALSFVDLTTLAERLKNRKSISMDVINKRVGWLRMSFISVETDKDNLPTKVIIATQVIDEDKKREEELSVKVHKDELTGILNRRAYENDLMTYPDVPPEKDFVYAAIDINGLKVVNDEFGHAAGDELIKGAADCLKTTLGNYGRVYRTGGDEFVSIFFIEKEQLPELIEDLKKQTSEWQGSMVKELTMSVGYVTKQEFKKATVIEMAKIADQRMYQEKSKFYSKKGIDRRGQAAAHKALCNLYTKILKINITSDTYSIINMDSNEQTEEKGFSKRISDWLQGFGKSGQVHQDDLKDYLEKTDINYLREYFKQEKTSLSIFYRRKYNEKYKNVVMEIIPADDYENDNQNLFLYVKSIDR